MKKIIILSILLFAFIKPESVNAGWIDQGDLWWVGCGWSNQLGLTASQGVRFQMLASNQGDCQITYMCSGSSGIEVNANGQWYGTDSACELRCGDTVQTTFGSTMSVGQMNARIGCNNNEYARLKLYNYCPDTQACPTYCGYPGGTVPNGNCGTTNCPATAACCTPNNSACAAKNCGNVVNNCGQTVSCGTCSAPLTCGGGGSPNVCGYPATVAVSGTFSGLLGTDTATACIGANCSSPSRTNFSLNVASGNNCSSVNYTVTPSAVSGYSTPAGKTVTVTCTNVTLPTAFSYTPQTTRSCTGTIQAKAVVVPSAAVTCAQVQSGTTGLSGTSFAVSCVGCTSNPPAQTQSGNTYVTFSSVNGGNYTLTPTAPAGYVLVSACWRKSLNAPGTGTSTSTSLSVPTDGDTLIWDLGYIVGTAWFQTGGGGLITSGGNVQSLMSTLASPRYLSLAGTGGYPGVLTAAGTLDLDADPSPTARGYNLVSVPKWQVLGESLPVPATDWYQWSVTRFGGSLSPDFTGPLNLTKPASRTAPYFLSGDFTTTGTWSIPAGEKLTLVVDGNVTITTPITVGTGGFFGLIVKGNITVDPRVGVIEGVYVTSPTGTISTGLSTNPGTEQLIARGIFGGGAISLERNLSSIGANATTPAEVFTYEPSFLMTMPEALKDMPISWEEVAP